MCKRMGRCMKRPKLLEKKTEPTRKGAGSIECPVTHERMWSCLRVTQSFVYLSMDHISRTDTTTYLTLDVGRTKHITWGTYLF